MRTILALSLALVTFGCSGGVGESGRPEGPAGPDVAADRITIDDRLCVLTATAWRDFMPGPGPRPSPLLAAISLETAGGEPLPDGFDVKAWTVHHGNETWRVDLDVADRRTVGKDRLERVARNGPAWPVGSTLSMEVDVSWGNAESARLRLAPLQVERTD